VTRILSLTAIRAPLSPEVCAQLDAFEKALERKPARIPEPASVAEVAKGDHLHETILAHLEKAMEGTT
jgi:predicted transcriptional regulator